MAAFIVGTRHKRVRNSLDVARDSFVVLVTGPRPLSLDGRRFPGLPPRCLPLNEVRDRLLDRTCPQSTSDAVWAYLVTQSRSGDPKWIVGTVGAALPALIAVATRLQRALRGDATDVQAEVLRGFLAAVSTVDIDRPRIILRLRWAAYRAGDAVVAKTLAAVKERAPGPSEDVISSHPDFLLAQAVAEGVLTHTTADLIGKTRLESVSVAEWAAQRGASEAAVYKARRRAELRLVRFLRERMTDAEDDMLEHVAAVLAVQANQVLKSSMSKTDADSGLPNCKEFYGTTASPEVRRCA